ncbi:NADH dehydrogenase (Ubiquinone) 30 kDa subunit [Carbonactinospora thermoautotrophica]|uniref:NADH dehydrogenase (Ubiquinone) 30 kDa subunit n=1 Tax=Carbonactinospora thermoautotrophica TaxID=1469144 RepID=A0A132MLG2_9ACTN|nr:NADH-quinone oxidoreductase subunit C [Carbonactinospora thermoautotrophica]KWW98623.1 NADH dehydrogenase (Ubiquinone) 30 kDa subunit [Carbonactinospora thermoautotrophica]
MTHHISRPASPTPESRTRPGHRSYQVLSGARQVSPNRYAVDITAAELHHRVAGLLTAGYRIALVAAHHDHPGTPGGASAAAAGGGAVRVVYLFTAGPPDQRVELHLLLDPDTPTLPSLAEFSFPASRFEREMHDLYGVVPLHHPLPRRLVRHQHWPRGWYPMRADAGPPPPFGDPEAPYPFLTVEGPGVYEIPVGPVHAGLIEPGHFRFSVVGETILKLKARLWFVHKGIEKLFEHHQPAARLPLAERVSGDTAVGHALAYCLAVEDALGWPVPTQARRLRAILLELERLYNHVGDIGALCNDVGHSVLHAHALRIRETLLRLNADVTGHRLLRGGVQLGGAAVHELPHPDQLRAIGADIRQIIDLALGHTVVRDRFTGTAVLTLAQARDIGTLGYVARASGLDYDARHAHPFLDLGSVLSVPTRTSGDVLARFLIRADEIDASLAILTHLIPGATPGRHVAPMPGRTPAASGVGVVEGWRGAITHRVELSPDHTLTRVKIVDPSFFNWPALPVALADTIVPDFPLANKSFNLSYAGNDL